MYRKCHVRYYKFAGKESWHVEEADGLFHQWGDETFEEIFTFTIGIVELGDGTIVTAEPRNIRFEVEP